MKCNALTKALSLACMLATCGAAVHAQTGAPPTHKPGLLHRMLGHGAPPGHFGKPSLGSGRFIGNRRSHVYHLPGDKGSLPSEKNRIYFRSESEARAAGYRPAGKSPIGAHGMSGHGMSHSMLGHGKMGHDQKDHPHP